MPECPNENRPFDKDEQEKAAQTMDNPNGSVNNSHEQLPYGSPDKASSKSSDESSEKSYHGRDSSSSYSSHDTELIDIRESEQYIASSDKERRRLVKKQDKICRMAKKSRLRRKIKAGKKAQAKEREDLAMWDAVKTRNLGKSARFEVEFLRVQESRAAEDRARDLSTAGTEGRQWSDIHQRALELQRVNDDYIKLAVELFNLHHWDYEGKKTLQYRAEEVTKLLKIFDAQWRQAYQRIGDNAVKLKEQTLHSAELDIRGLDIEKEPKASDETVRYEKRPKTKPKTKRPSCTNKPGPHPTMTAKPARKPAKPRQQQTLPEKLRRSSRLLAQKAGRKD